MTSRKCPLDLNHYEADEIYSPSSSLNGSLEEIKANEHDSSLYEVNEKTEPLLEKSFEQHPTRYTMSEPEEEKEIPLVPRKRTLQIHAHEQLLHFEHEEFNTMPGLPGRPEEPEEVEQPAFRKANSTYPLTIATSQELYGPNNMNGDEL